MGGFVHALDFPLGLSHADNLIKIRLLTLASLCADSTVVEFEAIAQKLEIEEATVENWVIDGKLRRISSHVPLLNRCYAVIKAGLVEAKVDQSNRKVVVT